MCTCIGPACAALLDPTPAATLSTLLDTAQYLAAPPPPMQPSAEQQHQAQSAAPAAAPAAAARLPRQKCEFWVARKNRCCRFEAIPGHKFCGNHFAAAEQEGGGPRRVVCPYDPRGAQ